MVDSCGECTSCRTCDEQYCLNGMVPTDAGTDRDGTTTQGGYSTHVVVDADYALSPRQPRPGRRSTSAVRASPPTHRCAAGAPARQEKVAVVGLGGLGHMAVKIADAYLSLLTVDGTLVNVGAPRSR